MLDPHPAARAPRRPPAHARRRRLRGRARGGAGRRRRRGGAHRRTRPGCACPPARSSCRTPVTSPGRRCRSTPRRWPRCRPGWPTCPTPRPAPCSGSRCWERSTGPRSTPASALEVFAQAWPRETSAAVLSRTALAMTSRVVPMFLPPAEQEAALARVAGAADALLEQARLRRRRRRATRSRSSPPGCGRPAAPTPTGCGAGRPATASRTVLDGDDDFRWAVLRRLSSLDALSRRRDRAGRGRRPLPRRLARGARGPGRAADRRGQGVGLGDAARRRRAVELRGARRGRRVLGDARPRAGAALRRAGRRPRRRAVGADG